MRKISIKKSGYEDVRYDSPDSLLFIKRISRQDGTAEEVPPHRHEDVEFLYVIRGEIRCVVNGTRVNVVAGNGIIINSARYHEVDEEKNSNAEVICVLINPAIICTTKHIEANFVMPILGEEKSDYFLLNKDIGWQEEIMERLVKCYDIYKADKNNSIGLTAEYFAIWRLMSENVIDKTTIVTESTNGIKIDSELILRTTLKAMLKYIYEHYRENIKLKDIAAAGNVCVSQCCKTFDKYLHNSPIDFLINYRLYKAIMMLRESSDSISQIAAHAGFSNSSYFAESFKNKVGCTPTQFKKDKTLLENLNFDLETFFFFDINK